jgi:hypothetical protein
VLLLTAFILEVSLGIVTLQRLSLEIYKKKLISKMGEQFKIIEYPLIILFILIGATFLMPSRDLVSMFLAIEFQSYGLYFVPQNGCVLLLVPAVTYSNAGLQEKLIQKENKGRAGVYR